MRKIKLIFYLCCILIMTGCTKENGKNDILPKGGNEEAAKVEFVENNEKEKEPLELIIDDMTIEEKIGQMIISGFIGNEYDDSLDKLLNEYKVGGVILFGRNIEDSNQMITLTKTIQEKMVSIPLFISIDEEGGSVSRLPDDVEKFPSAFTIGYLNDEEIAYENGKEIGNTLKNLAVNMDYAPVLDIFSNENNTVIGDRAFGAEAEVVSKMGVATMKGMQSAGIVPVVKHFPGHGDTEVDSHYGLPIVYKSLGELQNFEFVPFIKAIENGCDVIMASHIILNEIDNNNPASLSKLVINDILREGLGFNNVVITDDMAMGAITSIMSIEEACTKSIEAGCDILLLGNAYEEIEKVINSIKREYESGEISEERINESVARILRLKQKYNIMEESYE